MSVDPSSHSTRYNCSLGPSFHLLMVSVQFVARKKYSCSADRMSQESHRPGSEGTAHRPGGSQRLPGPGPDCRSPRSRTNVCRVAHKFCSATFHGPVWQKVLRSAPEVN